MDQAGKVIHPLAPVYDSRSQVLILGSFPSVVSRKMNFYYANRTNRFWPVLAAVFEEEITDRTEFCLRHGIALWDVIRSCTLEGSSDASIRCIAVNPIEKLVGQTNIRAVFTTGKKAGELYQKYIHLSLPHYQLPSTSAANASMKLSDLTDRYRKIREVLNEKN